MLLGLISCGTWLRHPLVLYEYTLTGRYSCCLEEAAGASMYTLRLAPLVDFVVFVWRRYNLLARRMNVDERSLDGLLRDDGIPGRQSLPNCIGYLVSVVKCV